MLSSRILLEVTLEELEGFFVHLRLKLLSTPVSTHLQSIVHKDLEMDQLGPKDIHTACMCIYFII